MTPKWLIIALAACLALALFAVAKRNERNAQIQAETDLGNLLDGNTEAFVKSVRQRCIEGRIRLFDRVRGTADQQVANYCQCFANAEAELFSIEVMVEFVEKGKLSESFQQKEGAIKPTCSRLLTQR